MKFSHVLVFALVALLSVSVALGAEREVRSYTNEMEYVDHVDVSSQSQESELPSAGDHAMMETGSEAPEAEHSAEGSHFVMESAEEFDADVPALLETSAEDELDTEVLRAMAVEIQNAAESQLTEDGEVVMMETEAEAETETEAEAEAEVEAEADPSDSGLTKAELAQEKADQKAEAAAKVAEAADNKEEAAEAAEAEADAVAAKKATTATATATAAAPKEAAKEATKEAAKDAPAAAPAKEAAKDAPAAAKEAAKDAPAATATATATAAPAADSVKREVVVLPADLSAEHAAIVAANVASTKVVGGALSEVNGILRAKDDTIRSLVYNVSYLTVTVGKLANKVDLQRSYIALLRKKLYLANLKNKELHDHVEHSADTVVNIRGQLKAVEERLNAQDKTTKVLSDFLTSNQDKTPLPDFDDNLDIQGPRTVVPKAARLARRVQNKVRVARKTRVANSRYRAVPGTQVFADAHHPAFLPATPTPAPAQWYPSSYYGNIPTIVVERQDNGQ